MTELAALDRRHDRNLVAGLQFMIAINKLDAGADENVFVMPA